MLIFYGYIISSEWPSANCNTMNCIALKTHFKRDEKMEGKMFIACCLHSCGVLSSFSFSQLKKSAIPLCYSKFLFEYSFHALKIVICTFVFYLQLQWRRWWIWAGISKWKIAAICSVEEINDTSGHLVNTASGNHWVERQMAIFRIAECWVA